MGIFDSNMSTANQLSSFLQHKSVWENIIMFATKLWTLLHGICIII